MSRGEVNARSSTVTLHVVSSLDGFIAKKDNSVSWMDSSDVYEKGVTDDGAEVLQSIDCYVLGSRTYEHALELGWPYGDTPTVVVTNRELPSTRKTVEFYSGHPIIYSLGNFVFDYDPGDPPVFSGWLVRLTFRPSSSVDLETVAFEIDPAGLPHLLGAKAWPTPSQRRLK